VGAGVHVDGDEGLGFVDDDFAAAGERDLALAGLLDLALDVEALEDRDAVLVERDLAGAAFRDLADELLGALVVGSRLSMSTRSTSSVRKSRTVRSTMSGSCRGTRERGRSSSWPGCPPRS
jgi:hypothetical protein